MYQAQILSHESSWMTIITVFWGLATFFQIKPESTAIMYVICTANANGQFVTMQYVFRLTSKPSHLIAYDYNIQLITICG